jgi:hypothetical protein
MIKSSVTVELSLLDAVTCASTGDDTTWGTTSGHRRVKVGEDPLAKEEERTRVENLERSKAIHLVENSSGNTSQPLGIRCRHQRFQRHLCPSHHRHNHVSTSLLSLATLAGREQKIEPRGHFDGEGRTYWNGGSPLETSP